MVMGPGIKGQTQCDVPIAGWDIIPTLCDLAGNTKPLPNYLDGTSIKPLLMPNDQGNFKRQRDELVFHYYGKSHSAIRLGDFKLIKFWDLKRTELYNLKNDPGELTDLAKSNPQKVAELESALMNYLKEVHAEILEPQLPKAKKQNNEDED
jgi:arylsulfatase A-like enzyme